jgi:hypothetical protein
MRSVRSKRFVLNVVSFMFSLMIVFLSYAISSAASCASGSTIAPT